MFRPPFSFRWKRSSLSLSFSLVFAYAFFPELDLSCREKEKSRRRIRREARGMKFSCVHIESSSLRFSLESFACSRNLSNGKRGLRGGRGGLETGEEIDASLIFSSTVKRMIMVAASSSEIFWSGCFCPLRGCWLNWRGGGGGGLCDRWFLRVCLIDKLFFFFSNGRSWMLLMMDQRIIIIYPLFLFFDACQIRIRF